MPPKRTNKINGDKSSLEKNSYLNQNSNACKSSKDANLLDKKIKSKARNSILLLNKKDKTQIVSDYKINKGNKGNKGINNTIKDINIKSNRKNSIYNRPIQGRRGSAPKARKKSFYSLFKGNDFSDYELNELEYQEAIEYDKRTFLVYYWSLIRREHLIIHTFFSFKDYNVFSIKLSKFVFSIAC
jgi:hypothetical protein